MTIENICIRGDKTNGKRIIQFFKRLGYENRHSLDGNDPGYYYFINHVGEIGSNQCTDRTLITLSDTLLPSEWCAPNTEEVRKYLNPIDEGCIPKCWTFIGMKKDEVDCSDYTWGVELLESQFKALTEDQREIEFEWTDELVREVLNSVYYPKMELKEKDWVEHINKFKASKREEKIKPKCGICGGEQVEIRGRYPGHDKRYTCPTCTQERLDQISEISAKGYGRVAQSKQ
jgi:hypothetical protein